MIKDTFSEFLQSVDLHSLQYLASVRVAIAVCGSEDVQRMIGGFRKSTVGDGKAGFSDSQWKKLCGKVKRKMKQIGVPNLIIATVLEQLWPISFQIFKWIVYHADDTGIKWSSNFCWTPQIKIDYEKTAEILVKDEALDIQKRFTLACFYCLDSQVRSLWQKMRLSERRSFFNRGNLKKSNQNPIILYWTYYIQEVPIDYWSSKALDLTRLLKYSVENGYLTATKYFLGKVKSNLRNRMTANCLYIRLRKLYNTKCIVKDHLAIACFLLCQLPSDDERTTIFNTLTLILRYFLEWPMQKHFMTVFNRMRHLLDLRQFGDALKGIFEKVMGDFKDYDYKALFIEFWHLSPESFKESARLSEYQIGWHIFMKFVKKHFGFVFENDSLDIKEKFRAFVFQQEVSEDNACFEKENVEFFKFLIRERVITKSVLEEMENRDHRVDFPFRLLSSFSRFDLPLGELKNLIDGILSIG